MPFPQLNSDVLALRNAIQSYIGPEALPEIRLAHPSGNSDEASFLRLTSWNYSLLFEVGRVTIPFLLKLPSPDRGPDKQLRESRESVRSLRTLASHNLGSPIKRLMYLGRRGTGFGQSAAPIPQRLDVNGENVSSLFAMR